MLRRVVIRGDPSDGKNSLLINVYLRAFSQSMFPRSEILKWYNCIGVWSSCRVYRSCFVRFCNGHCKWYHNCESDNRCLSRVLHLSHRLQNLYGELESYLYIFTVSLASILVRCVRKSKNQGGCQGQKMEQLFDALDRTTTRQSRWKLKRYWTILRFISTCHTTRSYLDKQDRRQQFDFYWMRVFIFIVSSSH